MQRHWRTCSTLLVFGAVVAISAGCGRSEPPATAERAPTPVPDVDRTPAEQAPAWITTKIQAQYFVNPEIKPWNIDVTTHSGGVVTLRGVVDGQQDRAEAVRIARQTDGVTEVHDLLRLEGEAVGTTGTDDRLEWPDLWVTTKIQSKYFIDDEVHGRKIDVDTQGGVVTLRGTVNSYAARRQAVALARTTEGVREVRDQLRVDTSPEPNASAAEGIDDAWIETKIQAKYFLDPGVKGRTIEVNVADNVVTLFGSVGSDVEKKTAEQIARETDGVKDVKNQLEVRSQPGTS